MKCPRCKNEVARLTQRPTYTDWIEGLCDTCDLVEKASDVPRLSAKATEKEPESPAPPVQARRPAKRKHAGRPPSPCRWCGAEKEMAGACPKCGKRNLAERVYMPGEAPDDKWEPHDAKSALPERVYVIELNEKQDAMLHRIVDTGLCGPTPEQAIIRILDRTFVEAGS